MEKKVIQLVKDTINKKDIDDLIEWLKTYPKLTKGNLTVEFEKEWSKFLGVKYSVFVNSGSSANLMMLYALQLKKLKNKKIVIPTIGWATDLSPAIQLGLKPILVDCNLEDLSVDINHLEEVFKKNNPSVLLLVSVLGLVPDMEKIIALCKKYDVSLLEDACESFGSEYKNKKIGTFGKMSSFSLFFGHHLSTIEGGMICTDDKELYNLLLMIRSHGWDRDLDEETQKKLQKKWKVSEFDKLFTFYVPGFNLRSTDLQAKIGLGQLKKANNIINKRNENFLLYSMLLKNVNIWSPKIYDDRFVSNFCFPLICENRNKVVKKLQENNIEVRPLISGSMGSQPMYVSIYGEEKLPNADVIDKTGFYIPNHPELKKSEIEFICNVIKNNI
jgi:CDP-6-deoxy-D-xylo-4-hexulose-3-dehydrase